MKAIDELFAQPNWDQTWREEIANSVSHGFGLAAAIVATPFLCMAAARQTSQAFYIGTIIFGTSEAPVPVVQSGSARLSAG